MKPTVRLATAIQSFYAAEAAIPTTATDAVMDAKVALSFNALDRVCRIPAFCRADVNAKRALARTLVDWDDAKERLVERANEERAIVEWNRKARRT